MRKQLTEQMIEKLGNPATGRLEIFDSIVPAMAVRVTPNGAKTYVVRSRVKGQPAPIRITIGDARGMRLATARQEASDVLRMCRAGDDPRAAKKAKVEEAIRQRKTAFALVAEAFIKDHVSKLRSKAHTEAAIRRHLIAPWGKRSIASITVDDVAERIQASVDAGSPHTGRRILAHAKRLFRWAAAPGRSYVKVNPCANLTAKDFEIEGRPRQVALSADQLRLVWQATSTLGEAFGPLIRMLMLCGQRRSEVADMTWKELDLEGEQVWIIPASRMKAKRPHEVPLSAPMVDLLKELQERRGKGPYVFSTTLGAKPISGFSKAKIVLGKTIEELRLAEDAPALPLWRLHDLRRTMRTGLGAIPDIAPDVRELVIAHVPPALVRTYDLHSYRDEKRQALELWAQRLLRIVEAPPAAGNVVELASRSARPKRTSATQAQ